MRIAGVWGLAPIARVTRSPGPVAGEVPSTALALAAASLGHTSPSGEGKHHRLTAACPLSTVALSDSLVLVVSPAQLSAPHHAECPRSHRWILAKTKSMLTVIGSI